MDKKKIKILTRGPIRAKGFINGPVLTPYFESTSTIFTMLTSGVHVVEVCEDGREVRLTPNNLYEDNSKVVEPEKVEEVKVETMVEEMVSEEPKVEEAVIEEDVVEEEVKEEVAEVEKVEEVKPEETKVEAPKPQYQNNYNKYQNNKNNKHNKHNSQFKVEPAEINFTNK